MKKDRTCPYCNINFCQIEGRIFSNHVRWCEKNPKHEKICGNSYKQKLVNKICQKQIDKNGINKAFKVVCQTCGKEFEVFEPEKLFPLKEKYFCSRSCANKRTHSTNVCLKISKAMQKKISKTKRRKRYTSCCICGTVYEKPRLYKTCSRSCGAKLLSKTLQKKSLDNFQKYIIGEIEYTRFTYKSAAQFRFAIQSFPDEFDFELIHRFGWYAAKNHGDNPNGVSRDHMYSIHDGYKNKIDPRIIAHPANCRIILQQDNCSKNKKSCITYDELILKIHIWEQKYGQFYKDFTI